MLAADAFESGEKNTVIAADLRVSLRSVERWRRSWRRDGTDGLRCSGPAKARKVGDEEFATLEEELLKGAVFHGWPDERWTLSRIQLLLAHVTGIQLSVRGVWELLRCHGWSCRQPARRAIERSEAAVASGVSLARSRERSAPRDYPLAATAFIDSVSGLLHDWSTGWVDASVDEVVNELLRLLVGVLQHGP